MFRPLECYIGLRYLRARGRNGFISFISLASMLGVAIGVAALIVILSVMNGFEGELRDRLLSMTAHAAVRAESGPLASWTSLRDEALATPGIVAAAPFVRVEAMLGRGNQLHGAEIRGVLPELESGVSQISGFMRQGRFDDLHSGGGRIILGRVLALSIGAEVGSLVTVLVPEIVADGTGIRPKLRSFTVSGIFEAGLQDHDGTLALVHLDDAAALAGHDGLAGGLRLQMDDVFAAPRLAEALAVRLGEGFVHTDWTRENATYFRAIRLEKTMMTTIMLLIVTVAAFNIVASLVMVVTEKHTDVAILRTLGLSAKSVNRVFIVQGAVIGVTGMLLGLALGIVLAANVDTIVPWLEQTFRFQIMPGDVYYVTDIPAEIRWSDVSLIAAASLLLTLLATLYPARRAAGIAPAEALRYD
ncbi:MAG: lipoprotein-releasing ABC transporter permease subunit [Gammaproteobacteria bacterium]|nr:lipoprotein-releasing ABC transporter permease subunit [Gammaproteobacteria bacterium]